LTQLLQSCVFLLMVISDPGVAKAQPRAGISERFQRYLSASSELMPLVFCVRTSSCHVSSVVIVIDNLLLPAPPAGLDPTTAPTKRVGSLSSTDYTDYADSNSSCGVNLCKRRNLWMIRLPFRIQNHATEVGGVNFHPTLSHKRRHLKLRNPLNRLSVLRQNCGYL
jgi:hypothetical protein